MPREVVLAQVRPAQHRGALLRQVPHPSGAWKTHGVLGVDETVRPKEDGMAGKSGFRGVNYYIVNEDGRASEGDYRDPPWMRGAIVAIVVLVVWMMMRGC